MMTPPCNRIDAILCRAAQALGALTDASPRLEAELLLGEASGLGRSTLRAWPERALAPPQLATFEQLLARRLAGEPLAYILGHQAFWTLELRVTPDTLIPRPETEHLVESALERLDPARALRLVDLGTGSGAIAAALASERAHWQLIATDRSAAALAVARENFSRLDLPVHCLRASWLEPFADASLDAILSNPPYIAAADAHLDRGDLRFEPRSALTPEGDGLAAIRAICADAGRALVAGGWLMVEHGFDQGAPVRALFARHGFDAIETRRDLAALERLTLGQRPL